MVEDFFGLSGAPFKLSPDPKFFFGSRSHNKAMAYLQYGLQQGEGFIVITGEVGAGKSLMIGHLLDELDRDKIAAAHIVTSNLDAQDVVRFILSGFKIRPQANGKAALLEAFEDFLIEQYRIGRRVLLIVDEAQNLPKKTIEELRMLSNINFGGDPLFQIFLVGQPEFKDIVRDPEMEQLRQRVIASYHLEALSLEETRGYIEHRLQMVGWSDDPQITDDAFAAIHRETNGIPRRINALCSRMLLFATLEENHTIDGAVIDNVIADMSGEVVQSARAPEAVVNADANGGVRADTHGAGDFSLTAAMQSLDAARPDIADLESRLQRLETDRYQDRHNLMLRLNRIEALLSDIQTLWDDADAKRGSG
ncbi:MAG: XrtA/PEP-CTERM system-associated ATPase [Pseudomonadota bacterium]